MCIKPLSSIMKKVSEALMSASSLILKARPRGLKNKAVVLVTLWSFVSFLAISTLLLTAGRYLHVILAIGLTISPVAGWLADVYFGRYRMISYCMRLLLATSIALNIYYIINDYVVLSPMVQTITEAFLTGLFSVGFVGILVNSIQFGMDQMSDASSTEIASFITGYVWSYALAFSIAMLTQHCFCGSLSLGVTFFLVTFAVAACVVSDFYLNYWFVKEPVTSNPLRLVYKVIQYAAKNKYPRMRSAFTYWDDKPYSRIDLGKTKYGGPFTTEQVEDVKTFFRVLALLAVCGLLIGVYASQSYANAKLMSHYQDRQYVDKCEGNSIKDYLNDCYGRVAVQHFHHFAVAIIVPVYELLLHPMLRKCACFATISAGIWFHVITGSFIIFICCLQQLVIEVVAALSSAAANETCLFYANSQGLEHGESLPLQYQWLIIPQTFYGIASFLSHIATFQFIFAQAPYNMRSQLVGILYSLYAILSVVLRLVLGVIKKGIKPYFRLQWDCGIWYYTAAALLSLLLFGFLFVVKRCYSPRRRDEDVHNEQMFAVDYYDKYLPPQESTSRKGKLFPWTSK